MTISSGTGLVAASLCLLIFTARSTLAFITPVSRNSQAKFYATVKTDASSNHDGERLKLPPGRRTPRRFFNFLFDDSLRLLNPKTMGSYQIYRQQQYGDIFKTNIFGRPTVFCTGESSMKELATEEATKNLNAFFPPHHQKLFGHQSMLVQSGAKHARLRRLVQPCLSPVAIQSMEESIETATDQFLSELQQEELDYFPVVHKLRSFFIDIAIRILLGSNEEPPANLSQDLTIWSKGLLAPPLMFIPWSTAAKAMRARKRIVNELQRLIQAQQASPNPTSLLGKLVSSRDEDDGDKLSADDIIDNVLTIVFAGSDTTASAATSMWMELSKQPQKKQRLKDNPDLLDGFLTDILHSYPPAPFTMRETQDELRVGGYVIPSGWLVVYGIAGVLNGKKDVVEHGDALSSSSSSSSSAAFGGGPRMCPGRYLATLELSTLCRKLIHLEWQLQSNQNLEQQYTPGFFPKDGLQIKFSK